MKAWKDLTSNKDFTICTTNNSEWYVNYGVKIERFEDGSFEVKNTMTNSDHYEEVTDEQMDVFSTHGWEAGCCDVNASVNLRKANKTKYLADLAVFNGKQSLAESLLESYQKLINKYYDYDIRLNNLLSL